MTPPAKVQKSWFEYILAQQQECNVQKHLKLNAPKILI